MSKDSVGLQKSATYLASYLRGESERVSIPNMSPIPETFTQSLHAQIWVLKAPFDGFKTHPRWLRLFIHKQCRPDRGESFKPLDGSSLAICWRDRLNCPLGNTFLSDYLSLEELDASGVFAPVPVRLALVAWKHIPTSSQIFQTLDPLIGFILTSQILLRLESQSAFIPSDKPSSEYPTTNRLSDWNRFVLRHTKSGNFWFHFVSMLFFFGSPFLALITRNPYWLALFFSSGVLGTAGHYFFKDGGVSVKEATIQLMVPIFVLRMFYLLTIRRYEDEVKKAQHARESSLGQL
ncbi:MAG: hypothetical protein H7249_19715 [Chitinophagaceae bacterium]|nr:hypothetical protein [Oligoflexus sp.]